jgi:hypothetical protein
VNITKTDNIVTAGPKTLRTELSNPLLEGNAARRKTPAKSDAEQTEIHPLGRQK